MSYTPPEQELTPSILKTLTGLEQLATAIDVRLKDKEAWSAEHRTELRLLQIDIINWQFRLRELNY